MLINKFKFILSIFVFLLKISKQNFLNNSLWNIGVEKQLKMNYFTGNEHENIGVINCKHFCSISNPNSLSCWNETLQFYESMLINILRQTVIVEINRVLWIHSNQNDKIKNSEFFGTNVEKLANDSLSRFMKLPNKSSVKDGNNWRNSKNVFARISPAIAKNVFHHVKHIRLYNYGLELPLLDFNCPQGCEKEWDIWKWLFFVSLLITFLFLVLLSIFVLILDIRERSLLVLESEGPIENIRMVRIEDGRAILDEKDLKKNKFRMLVDIN
uniref:Uncharacterized protein n=1 Tax=Meloidogyne enterolobii TaxID=390850 RepID=A0A6V7XMI1_MELEN|nr:unnamed protein product [Meloidogyne enterolobii]